jgi:hypothetical protein
MVDGPTQCRNRALAAQGYTVVSIPWWEWWQLKGAEQQQQYLQDKLKGMLGLFLGGWCVMLVAHGVFAWADSRCCALYVLAGGPGACIMLPAGMHECKVGLH